MRRKKSGYLIGKYPAPKACPVLNSILQKSPQDWTHGELKVLADTIIAENDRRVEEMVRRRQGLERLVNEAPPLLSVAS